MLVWHDLLGLSEGTGPRFVKRYADLASEVRRALQAYAADVRAGSFPEERHAYAMAEEFKQNRYVNEGGTMVKSSEPRLNITALALTPGFLRSEAMLDYFGVTEANWRDAIAKDPYYAESETPHYIGRAVVALACDPNVHEKAGKALATWHLSREYGFTDVDGRAPHWQEFFERMQAEKAAAGGA
ncbi:MAG: hypothetical protein C4299_03925 [Thermoleophilia bacterium]